MQQPTIPTNNIPKTNPTEEEVQEFSLAIVKTAKTCDMSHLDALVLLCEKRNIEPEVASVLLTPYIKNLIQRDAEDLNFLKVKKKRLPR